MFMIKKLKKKNWKKNLHFNIESTTRAKKEVFDIAKEITAESRLPT